MVFWGLELNAGEKASQVAIEEGIVLNLATASLATEDGQGSARIFVKINGKAEFMLCALDSKNLSVSLRSSFDSEDKIAFLVKGTGVVHLTGYTMDEDEETDSEFEESGTEDDLTAAIERAKATGKTVVPID
ncbi:hypothetical protein HDE_07607 [Halotydeus destructor]|nr:hypothetical protein HDE_07607 [Halotydeus destructor]